MGDHADIDHTGLTGVGGGGSGEELDYVQLTSTSSPSATTEAGATAIITGNAVAYDGSTAIIIHCFLPTWEAPTDAGGSNINLWLYDGSSSIGQIGFKRIAGTGNNEESASFWARLTPSNATHTYSVRVSIGTGTAGMTVGGGAGGAGNTMPAFLRITKA